MLRRVYDMEGAYEKPRALGLSEGWVNLGFALRHYLHAYKAFGLGG
jgi:hypothetical protein